MEENQTTDLTEDQEQTTRRLWDLPFLLLMSVFGSNIVLAMWALKHKRNR